MNKIVKKIKKEEIKRYEIMSIETSSPDFFIPMEFVEYDDYYSITYDCSGYTKMSECLHAITVRDAFDCIEGIMEAYRRAMRFLIFPERLILSDDTVYFNKNERSVKLMFVPPEAGIEVLPASQITAFLDDMKSIGMTNGSEEYLEVFKEYIGENQGFKELQNRAIMIKREAKICGIE